MQEKWLNGPVLTECLAQGQIPRTNIKKWDHMITWTLALLWGRMRRSLRIAEYWFSSRFNEILCLDYGRLRPRGQTTSEFAVSLSPRNVEWPSCLHNMTTWAWAQQGPHEQTFQSGWEKDHGAATLYKELQATDVVGYSSQGKSTPTGHPVPNVYPWKTHRQVTLHRLSGFI